MPDQLRHAILGVGGVGGLIGACLSHFGAEVTLVVKPESLAHYPRQLRLESPFGNITANVACAAEVPPVDVLWLTVKATQLTSALTAITDPARVRAMVPLLNGIDHLGLLRSKYGAEKIIPATIAVESERIAPAHIVHRSPFVRLNVLSTGEELLAHTLDQFRHYKFDCKFIADEPTLMWGKLVFLGPLALTTTAANGTIGTVLDDPDRRSQLERCIRETCTVAIAEGAKIDTDAVVSTALRMPPAMRSSMQKDVAQGNPPELDAIAGPILRCADKHSIPVSATRDLVDAVERQMAAHSVAGSAVR